ncbi:MAG TPA: pre-peptidase C-terminal domain-containing protein [Allosphingosinicella sp.]|nr:pre-peptidase C-terminal domain-containing protein [Allosphingosinicella sp.]
MKRTGNGNAGRPLGVPGEDFAMPALTDSEIGELVRFAAGHAARGPELRYSQMRRLPELAEADAAEPGLGEANGAGRTQLIDQYYDAVQARYEFSGNQDIDAVLIGSRWTIRSFTFSFPTSGAFYANQGYQADTEPSAHTPFNAQQQAAVRYAYALLASYTGLTFTEVTETATVHADFRFSQTGATDDVPSALANFPSSMARAGDVWFGTSDQPFYTTPAIGNWGMATILHEMGHTMGLKHGHSDLTTQSLAGNIDAPPGGGTRFGSAALPTHHDGQDWALMSYRSDPTVPGETVFAGEGFNQPQTYMQNDIAALQYLYGANYNHNAGNTVYSWNPGTGAQSVNGVVQGAPSANKISMTVWDGNGIDTYDLSNYATDLLVNLQPGAFSTFSYDQLVNHQAENGDGDEGTSGGAIAVGNVANALLYRNNTRSLIENATGGSGDDHMVGNQAANTLRGGAAGADTLIGDAGNDMLFGGAGSDSLFGDGAAAVASGVGMGSGALTKPPGGGNFSPATAYNVTNFFSLAANADILDATTVPHVTVSANGDNNFDFYALTVTAGTVLTFDIDNTFALDTIILLRDAGGNLLAFNDDASTPQGAEGSIFPQDSFLTYTVTRSGTYYLQVAEFLGAGQIQGPLEFTSYQLHISAAGRTAVGGGAGNDTLDGGAGADMMLGGAGNDTYLIDVAGDRAIEAAAASGGIDTVRSLIGYTLGSGLERLVLLGTAAIGGTGNSLANSLTGNAAANSLTGVAGDDMLNGAAGGDTLRGGAGNDVYVVDNALDRALESASQGTDTVQSTIAWTLGAQLENLVLTGAAAVGGTGNALANALTGNAAANVLNGGGGADRMAGGGGGDTYVVDDVGDRVIEAANAGLDTVRSFRSLALAANIENLTLLGSAANGVGNTLANRITGSAAANVLNGGGGKDRLVGGGGDDMFVFNTALSSATNWDDILDFVVDDDTIVLDRTVFTAIAGTGGLAPTAFVNGAAAGDGNDRILYDQANGRLYYDADGSGPAAKILFAHVDPGLALTAADFLAVA